MTRQQVLEGVKEGRFPKPVGPVYEDGSYWVEGNRIAFDPKLGRVRKVRRRPL